MATRDLLNAKKIPIENTKEKFCPDNNSNDNAR